VPDEHCDPEQRKICSGGIIVLIEGELATDAAI
jgi:hypothetical protein